LRQKKFRPFPKVAKAKAAAEPEDVEANDKAKAEEASSSTSTDYEYLLGMAIWSLIKKVRRHLPVGTCLPSSHASGCSRFDLACRWRSSFCRRRIWRRSFRPFSNSPKSISGTRNTNLGRFLEEWEVSVQHVVAFSLRICSFFFWRYVLTSYDRKRVKSGTTRPKQATLTSQKSIGSGERLGGGGDEDDEDDNFMPTKKGPLPKSRNHRTHRR
jgi:hypothetical protein